jgi:hypothetical protein
LSVLEKCRRRLALGNEVDSAAATATARVYLSILEHEAKVGEHI